MAVSVLHETWNICSKGLGNLFTHMKQMEMTRRTVRTSDITQRGVVLGLSLPDPYQKRRPLPIFLT